MPLPVINGTTRCAIVGTLVGGQTWANVIHCRYQGGSTFANLAAITALDTSLIKFYAGPAIGTGTFWLQSMQNTAKLNSISYTNLDGSSVPIVINRTLSGSGGSGQQAPQEVAPCITMRTAIRGRRNRGRLYLPTPLTAKLDLNGLLIAAFVQSTLDQLTGVKAELVAKQWEIGVASYGVSHLKDGTTSRWAPYFTPLDTPTMDLKPDVQRRRK